MKKYSLTDRWENDKPVNTFDFNTLDELQQIDMVKKAMQHPNFHQLSIQVSCVLSYYPPNYSNFTLLTELHDGYIFEELGNLTKNPIDYIHKGFPSNTKTCPVVCKNFDPIKELTIPLFKNRVAALIGNNAARAVEKLKDIDMVKKFIEYELQYQLEHPDYNKPLINIDKILKHNKE